jgi:glycosyltransferase involved in cell wall biosynthesis
MRVLYSFPHALGAPGIGTTALNQLRALVRLGIDVDVYAASFAVEVPGDGRRVATLAAGPVRVPHRALGVARAYAYHDLRVATALRARSGAYDVVHAWPRSCLRTFAAARRTGVRAVREVPNTHTGHAYERVARELEELGMALPSGHSHAFDAKVLSLEEAEYRLADVLLVPSPYVRQTFLERGFPADRLSMHRYGFDPDRFAPGPDRERGPFTAVFLGRAEPRKGLHYALRAWHESGLAARGRFLIAGSFTPAYRELLSPWIDDPSVEVVGFVDDTEALLQRCDVLLLPSVEEGSALVTYEAMACGCVPLVSDAAGARCRHGREGLIHAAGDVAALAADLRLLESDRGLLAEMRAAALAARSELTWDAAAREVSAAYAG